MLRGELVLSLLEFAPNKLLVATETSHLILFHDWVRVKAYKDTNPQHGLKAKGHLAPLPGFDPVNFPFIAQACDRSINLINLKEASSESLISAETTCLRGQPAFFFKKEQYGMSLNFTHKTQVDTKNDHIRLNWTRMALKPDFAATLQRVGGLPLSKKEDIIEL